MPAKKQEATKNSELRDALKRIEKYGKKNTFAKNAYSDGELLCPIGQFFSVDQLAHINMMINEDGLSMNGDNVLSLAIVLGESNIYAATGMTALQANAIQHVNDMIGQQALMLVIGEILKGKRDQIAGVPFIL